MSKTISFESPENIPIQYELAGLGTRFVAWFVDQVLLWLLTIALLISLAIAGISAEGLFESFNEEATDDPDSVALYLFGLMALIWGLGSFVYFGLSELLLRGQTVGKRVSRIRVVNASGFGLDPTSILVRNLFRVADHVPLLWIIPVMSGRSQRAGDMVAGTVVVSDDPQTLTDVRAELSERTASEAEFRFGEKALAKLRSEDFLTIEKILDRWEDLPEGQRNSLLNTMVEPLAKRLAMDPPDENRRLRFLEDLLAAEIRRQHRALS